MRKFAAPAALMLMALAGACSPPAKETQTPDAGTGDGGGGGASGVSYTRDVKPILIASCNECHHAASAIGYDFTNPFDPAKGIINRANSYAANGSMYPKIVDPGNPATSALIAKVERTDLDEHTDGAPMPLEVPYLSAA